MEKNINKQLVAFINEDYKSFPLFKKRLLQRLDHIETMNELWEELGERLQLYVDLDVRHRTPSDKLTYEELEELEDIAYDLLDFKARDIDILEICRKLNYSFKDIKHAVLLVCLEIAVYDLHAQIENMEDDDDDGE